MDRVHIDAGRKRGYLRDASGWQRSKKPHRYARPSGVPPGLASQWNADLRATRRERPITMWAVAVIDRTQIQIDTQPEPGFAYGWGPPQLKVPDRMSLTRSASLTVSMPE